jgi:hypothetical protein
MNKDFRKELEESTNPSQRIELAKDFDCPVDLLRTFIEQDVEPSVILAAALNVSCPDELLSTAADRAGWRLDLLIQRKRTIIKEYYDSQDTKDGKFTFSDRDAFLVKHIINRDNKHGDIHLGDYTVRPRRITLKESRESDLEIVKNLCKKHRFSVGNLGGSIVTKDKTEHKEHIVLIICPSWGIIFPPYNLAKITGLLRSQGYKVTIYDLNIDSYHILKQKTGVDFWSSEKYHLWFEDRFDTQILPHLKEYINDIMEEIIDINPTVVGFSLYNTNMWCSRVVMQMVRDILPETTIAVGGPEASQDKILHIVREGVINYIFKGEAEETFLNFLEEKKYTHLAQKEIIGTLESKIQLDQFPFPDYSDYDLNHYLHPDGVSIETSRGCIAQCSFCSETWFWKFRQRTPERVIEEMQDQISQYGVSRFWFVDSLANGNMKAFRQLVDLMISNKLDVKWNSYARNDGRMDRDFVFKIAESGCTSLSFGVETGSQKLLYDMKKKVDIWEIENNLRDCYDAGMDTHVNWMIGFPTEDNLDFLHGMILVWNTGKYIAAISPGMGCGPAAFSDLENSWQTYGITWKDKIFDTSFLGHWYTKDYKNTALHRVVRIKVFAVFLDILKSNFNISPHNGQSYDGIKSFYKLDIKRPVTPNNLYVKQLDNLNLNILNDNNNLSTSIANEYLGLAWLLYSIVQTKFTLTINFDPATDLNNFGAFIAVNYTAQIKIVVSENGNFDIAVDHELKHATFNRHWENQFKLELEEGDKSFKRILTGLGNFKDLEVDYKVLGETVHEQYRKQPKTIMINHE